MEQSDLISVEQKKELILEAIREKKGHQIVSIDLSDVENSICDFFIICHGESVTQVGAITESIEKKLKEENPFCESSCKKPVLCCLMCRSDCSRTCPNAVPWNEICRSCSKASKLSRYLCW